ncbi:MAG: lipoyl(octanoyl) transferase LipB [Janthinobacterium lividum]
MKTTPLIIQRGHEPYQVTFDAMRAFTAARDASTSDQLWIVEHGPVYTLGLAANRAHVLDAHGIEVIQTDRGGEVTFHGPGQAVVYLLIDLRRQSASGRLYPRELVIKIEQAVIDTLALYAVIGERREGAPGIYLADGAQKGAKIAALGLKVRASGHTYHGVSLNVDMDLAPFGWINPCGYAGLETVDLRSLGIRVTLAEVQAALAAQMAIQLARQ